MYDYMTVNSKINYITINIFNAISPGQVTRHEHLPSQGHQIFIYQTKTKVALKNASV